MSNNTFNETNGELLNMQFDGFLNDDILISNIHFITPDGTDYAFDSLNVVHGATDIIDVNKTSNSDNSIYNLQGQKLETVSKGINIVNGKKVVVK